MDKRTVKNSAAGFTLAEVLVVVVIIGIAAIIAIPMVSSTSGMQVTSAAREISSALLYAQTVSISTKNQYQVVFDTANNSYSVCDAAGNVIKNPVFVNELYQVDYDNDDRRKNLSLVTADFDGTNTVWFDQLGSPYAGAISASPTTMNSGTITVQAGDKSMNITIEPFTGRININ
ncbi:MAG: prepilin-type N-terminal cleavage/methylation domain-containing protein [Sedimentisphaerales bacterium]|nr:prepilin-type N-terminal cleavage/methylation domain-containing protein [Sedimentisphaerales bacterium]